MPKIFLRKNVDEIPKVGDRYIVLGIYPNTTDDLWRPRVEVHVELLKLGDGQSPDQKDKEPKDGR